MVSRYYFCHHNTTVIPIAQSVLLCAYKNRRWCAYDCRHQYRLETILRAQILKTPYAALQSLCPWCVGDPACMHCMCLPKPSRALRDTLTLAWRSIISTSRIPSDRKPLTDSTRHFPQSEANRISRMTIPAKSFPFRMWDKKISWAGSSLLSLTTLHCAFATMARAFYRASKTKSIIHLWPEYRAHWASEKLSKMSNMSILYHPNSGTNSGTKVSQKTVFRRPPQKSTKNPSKWPF